MFFFITFYHIANQDFLNFNQRNRRISSPSDFFERKDAQKDKNEDKNEDITRLYLTYDFNRGY